MLGLTGLKTTKAVVHFALARLTATTRALSALADLSGKVRFHRGYYRGLASFALRKRRAIKKASEAFRSTPFLFKISGLSLFQIRRGPSVAPWRRFMYWFNDKTHGAR
ncbi:MAG: hypothetical protein HY543_04640 [Deltaproteobacteria bacterium]|nr:hypothetical protein [Deltaproteobacteria bacterium]